LIEICLNYDIKAIIPLYDPELPILSNARDRFIANDIYPVVSNPEVIQICDDKLETNSFLKSHYLNCPKTLVNLDQATASLANHEIHFPIIIKPRWGMGSIGVYEATDENELNFYYSKVDKIINQRRELFIKDSSNKNPILIQEKIAGTEYSLDVINDLETNYVTTIVKEKIAMRAGETDIAKTVDNPELIALEKRSAKTWVISVI